MANLRNPIDWLIFLLISSVGRAILLSIFILSVFVAVISVGPQPAQSDVKSDAIITISDTENCRVIKQEQNTATFACDIVRHSE
jgi:tetrahydromethanopterin S-methyltransferase subunit D